MAQWPGKLLLLGEYSVLLGGEALAIPLRTFQGGWAEPDGDPDPSLAAWLSWLEKQEAGKGLPWPLDIRGFRAYVHAGGRFRSDIPAGCGLGSSGALVAGLATCWAHEIPDDLKALQQGLARLESFFHGNSSGLDPLVSFLGQAIRLDSQGIPRALGQMHLPPGMFLYDSGLSRQTAPLVARFRQRLEDRAYRRALETDLLPVLAQALQALLTEDFPAFRAAFSQISEAQGQLFPDMIPEALRPLWKGPVHVMKLCGAGGGGFFLGLSSDPPSLELDAHRLHWLGS